MTGNINFITKIKQKFFWLGDVQLIDELAIEDIKRSNKTMTGYKSAIDSMFFSMGQVLIFKKKNKLFK